MCPYGESDLSGYCLQQNSITSATEAACLVLSIDETVKNPTHEAQPDKRRGRGGMAYGAGNDFLLLYTVPGIYPLLANC